MENPKVFLPWSDDVFFTSSSNLWIFKLITDLLLESFELGTIFIPNIVQISLLDFHAHAKKIIIWSVRCNFLSYLCFTDHVLI